MKDRQRDLLRKVILQFVKKGYVHYADIEKRTRGYMPTLRNIKHG
ncbi:MAG: hypothetical protein AOA66_1205 [Candidatus Bathyarchaeota archaeon BA2]|nr:MAG: hypothetical protein AOA66_1205 [Candidatus Bathyarchaeota archaeon BA2]